MRRIRTKLIVSLLIAIVLPIFPSYLVVKDLLDRSVEIGFNAQVEQALEDAARFTRALYNSYKNETLQLAEELAESPAIAAYLQRTDADDVAAEPVPSAVAKTIHQVEKTDLRYTILLYNAQAQLVGHFRTDSTSVLEPVPEAVVRRLWQEKAPQLLPEFDDPRHIAAGIAVGSDGALVFVRDLEANFFASARQVIEVNQMFKSLGLISDDLKRGFLVFFLVIYVPIAVLSIGVGYFFSHRLTSPLLKLVDATRIVAAGNWDYRLNVSTKDEIGQLVTAFNQMIETIREKQEQALAEEAERRRIEVAHEQKVKDLELAELRTRALQAENDRKSIELEKAQELEKAYQALEASHQKLKETQAQLIQSEKMASLGNLVAGVAHEINNPIGAIHSAADVSVRAVERIHKAFDGSQSLTELQQDRRFQHALHALAENTQLIESASNRVNHIVRSLKTFARLDEAHYQRTNIHDGLDSTLMLLHHEIKNRIQVEKQYGQIPLILCYPNELNQVFMNILANAAQAITGQGTIRIRTRIDDSHVYIDIEDDGRGIPPEKITKIFDPGFTTRGVGVGTGLGLSISYNIIKKHRGEIRVKSEVGEGTTFTIVLPIAEENATAHADKPAAAL